jgi:hypothetical protein
MRVAFILICSLVFASLSAFVSPAKAGEYGGHYVWTSGSCCHQKVVRHQRDVRYLLAGACRPYGVYCTRPRVYAYRPEPRRVVRFSEFDFYTTVADYAEARCHWREVPLRAGRSFWVWGVKTDCY